MPRPNTRSRRKPGVYHVYNRAREGRPLFFDDEDRMVFEDIMNRYLSRTPQFDRRGRQYPCFRDAVRLNARCLLTTHHHQILNQMKPGGMDRLMAPTTGAYTRYYNQRHGTEGPLFLGPFRDKPIETPEQFKWRIAYVHDNHKRLGLEYRFSTHRLFLD